MLGGTTLAQAPSLAPQPSPTPPPGGPLAGSWQVLAFDAWNEGLAEPRPDTELTVAFLSDGRLEGETGCGTYFGGYSLADDRLGLGIIGKGPEPCDIETTEEAVAYSVALESVVAWRPVAGGVELLDEAGGVRVVLLRSADAGLRGTWIAERYARANGRWAEPLADRSIRITFGDDDRLEGSSGCRLLEGMYMRQRDQVLIAPVETTGLPCEGDARRQERRLLRIFEETVFWQRAGAGLVLEDGFETPLLELRAAPMVVEASPSAAPSAPPTGPESPG